MTELGQGQDLLSIASMVAGLILIVFLAYWATKIVGKKYGASFSGTNILRVIDRLPLGPEKQLLIVRAGTRVLLLGVTAQSIESLGELDPETIPEQPLPSEGASFSTALKTAIHFRRGGVKINGEKPNDSTEG